MNKLIVISLVLLAFSASAFANQGPPPAPEIDASSIGTASALICSAVLMIRGRKKN